VKTSKSFLVIVILVFLSTITLAFYLGQQSNSDKLVKVDPINQKSVVPPSSQQPNSGSTSNEGNQSSEKTPLKTDVEVRLPQRMGVFIKIDDSKADEENLYTYESDRGYNYVFFRDISTLDNSYKNLILTLNQVMENYIANQVTKSYRIEKIYHLSTNTCKKYEHLDPNPDDDYTIRELYLELFNKLKLDNPSQAVILASEVTINGQNWVFIGSFYDIASGSAESWTPNTIFQYPLN